MCPRYVIKFHPLVRFLYWSVVMCRVLPSLLFFQRPLWPKAIVLHIDPWPSHKSEIHCTGGTCENKRKKLRDERKCVGVKKLYMQMSTWDTSSLWDWVLTQFAVIGAPASSWAPHWGSVPQSGPLKASGWVLPGQEAEDVLSGILKITQRGMVKRRCYGSI